MLGNGREYLYESSEMILKMDVPRQSSCVERWNGKCDTRTYVCLHVYEELSSGTINNKETHYLIFPGETIVACM